MTGTPPTGKESTILAWVAMLIILSIPASIAIIYCRQHIRDERELRKWITEEVSKA